MDVLDNVPTAENYTWYKCNKADISFLEELGYEFGDCNNGILVLLFSIFTLAFIAFAVALCVYCFWPQNYRDKGSSLAALTDFNLTLSAKKKQTPQAAEAPKDVPAVVAAPGKGQTKSTQSEEQHPLLPPSSAKNTSNEDKVSKVNRRPIKTNTIIVYLFSEKDAAIF